MFLVANLRQKDKKPKTALRSTQLIIKTKKKLIEKKERNFDTSVGGRSRLVQQVFSDLDPQRQSVSKTSTTGVCVQSEKQLTQEILLTLILHSLYYLERPKDLEEDANIRHTRHTLAEKD